MGWGHVTLSGSEAELAFSWKVACSNPGLGIFYGGVGGFATDVQVPSGTSVRRGAKDCLLGFGIRIGMFFVSF